MTPQIAFLSDIAVANHERSELMSVFILRRIMNLHHFPASTQDRLAALKNGATHYGVGGK